MDPFRRLAVFTVARDAAFVTLTAVLLMLAFSFRPDLALCLGASAALLYSLGLLLRVGRLTEERIVQTEPWYALKPGERPYGAGGRRWARDNLEELLLRFAQGASGVASVLFSTSLLTSLT